MKIIGHILFLGLISIIIQIIEQIILARTTSFEYIQETKHRFIISTMFVFIICMYFLLRRWNNKTRPHFLKSLTIMFFVQVLTIVSLTVIHITSAFFSTKSDFLPDTTSIALQFDPSDFIAKTLIFACGLPLIILIPIYWLDRQKKQSN